MKKQILIGVAVIVVLASGTGFGIWKHGHKKTDANALTLLQGDEYSLPSSQSQDNATGSGTGPLANNPGTSSGGLNVSAQASNSLGQIAPTGGQAANSAGGSNGGGSASSGSSPFDPTTFAQYEKYKDGQSGLFGDVKVGSGAELKVNMKAAVYYKGWLTNGTLFDQSRPGSDGKIQPFIFTLGAHQVIPGWEQALEGMKVGGTRLLIIPPAVGYGASGQGSIPPNSTLVFQVELAEVQ